MPTARLDNLKYHIISEREDTAEETKLQAAIKTISEQIEVLKSDKKDQASRIHFACHEQITLPRLLESMRLRQVHWNGHLKCWNFNKRRYLMLR